MVLLMLILKEKYLERVLFVYMCVLLPSVIVSEEKVLLYCGHLGTFGIFQLQSSEWL